MTNLEEQNNIYTFSINGDLKTTKIAIYGPIMHYFTRLYYWIGISPYLVPEIIPAHINTWIVFVFILGGLAGAFLIKDWIREIYETEVKINKNTHKISAYDRQRDQIYGWEDFIPNIYIQVQSMSLGMKSLNSQRWCMLKEWHR